MNAPTDLDKPALLIAGLTALGWGLTGIFVRLLPPLSPVTVTAGRLLIALAVALPVLLWSRHIRRGFLHTVQQPAAYLLALLLGAYYLLATAAFQMAPVAEVALLLSTPPLYVLLLRRLRGDRPHRLEVGGALLAVGGIGLLMSPALAQTGTQATRLAGDGIAIAAAMLTALYAYAYRGLAQQGRAPESLGVTLLTFVLGSALATPAAITLNDPVPLVIHTELLFMFAGLGILSTALPSLGFALAARRLPATLTATIALFIPLFAAVFAWWLLDEALSLLLLPGGIMVLGGVGLILFRGKHAAGAVARKAGNP